MLIKPTIVLIPCVEASVIPASGPAIAPIKPLAMDVMKLVTIPTTTTNSSHAPNIRQNEPRVSSHERPIAVNTLASSATIICGTSSSRIANTTSAPIHRKKPTNGTSTSKNSPKKPIPARIAQANNDAIFCNATPSAWPKRGSWVRYASPTAATDAPIANVRKIKYCTKNVAAVQTNNCTSALIGKPHGKSCKKLRSCSLPASMRLVY